MDTQDSLKGHLWAVVKGVTKSVLNFGAGLFSPPLVHTVYISGINLFHTVKHFISRMNDFC